jgi:TolA-binding protein
MSKSLRKLGLFVGALMAGGWVQAEIAHSVPSASKKVEQKSSKNRKKVIKTETTAPLPVALVSSQIQGVESEESRDFTRAQDLLKGGKESEAMISLSDFLRRYPTSLLADDAQFSIAEIFFRQ